MKQLAPLPQFELPSSAAAGGVSVRLISSEQAVAAMRIENADFRDAYDALGHVDWGVEPAPAALTQRRQWASAQLLVAAAMVGGLAATIAAPMIVIGGAGLATWRAIFRTTDEDER